METEITNLTSKEKKNEIYDEIMDEFNVALNVLAGNIDPDELTPEEKGNCDSRKR